MKLSFNSYTSARLRSGQTLLFPAWNGAGCDPKPAAGDDKHKPLFLRLSPSRQPNHLEGAIVGSALDVVLARQEFRKIRSELRRRQLEREPIVFDYTLDDDGALSHLRVDGRPVCGDQRRDSGIEGLAPGGRPKEKVPAQ